MHPILSYPCQPVKGYLNSRKRAARKSASAKSLATTKQYGAETKPKEATYLTNKNVRRMRMSAAKTAMRLQQVVNLPSEKERKKYTTI